MEMNRLLPRSGAKNNWRLASDETSACYVASQPWHVQQYYAPASNKTSTTQMQQKTFGAFIGSYEKADPNDTCYC